jgi:hypothetical protein
MSSSETVLWSAESAVDEVEVATVDVAWLKEEGLVLGSPIEFLFSGTMDVLWLAGVLPFAAEVVTTASASSWEEMERSMMASTGALIVVVVEVL